MKVVSYRLYSAFGKSLCTYKWCWKWCPRASIQAWTRLILFANTFCRSACLMLLMNAVIAVFNSLSLRGGSRYTADFAAPHRSKCTTTFRTHCSRGWSDYGVEELAEGIDFFVLRWLEETPVWQLVLWEENLLDECLGIELRKVVIALATGYNDIRGGWSLS
jgi:hypothetical protein